MAVVIFGKRRGEGICCVCDRAGGKVSKETYTLSTRLDANHNNENAFRTLYLNIF